MNICRICLRTDRNINVVHDKLVEFHDELCEHTMDSYDPQYCTECEYLLKKTFNFKLKCEMAVKIYNNWKSNRISRKKPIELLYTVLPPSSLGYWTQTNNKIYTYREDGPTSCGNIEDSQPQTTDPMKTIIKKDQDINDRYEQIYDEIEVVNESTEQEPNIKDDETILQIEENLLFNIKSEDSNDSLASEPMDVNNDQDLEVTIIMKDHSWPDHSKSANTKATVNEPVNIYLSDAKANEKISVTKKNARRTIKKKAADEMTVKDVLSCKERLLSVLNHKFALSGEVKTADGATIDSRFILECVTDKLRRNPLRQLWKAVRGQKIGFNSKAIELFSDIQDQYKNAETVYESVFNIEYYNTKKEMEEGFQKRKTYHCYEQADFKCEWCYQVFKYQKKLDYHNMSHEESAGEFECCICSVRYKMKKALSLHMRSHQAVYRCKLCPMVTHYRTSMVHHYHQHKGKEYRCEPCNLFFKSKSGYNVHMSKHHQRGGHVCTLCAREFESQHKLEWHTTRHHAGAVLSPDSAVACDSCPLSFPSLAVLHKHKHLTHGAKPSTTQRRRRIASSGPQITCRVCDTSGPNYGWLTLHFKLEHPTLQLDTVYADKNKCLCHVCGKGFWTVSYLRLHEIGHSGARPHACPTCPKRFPTAMLLAGHRLYHSPPDKACSVCGKKFHSPSNLRNHMRIHIGNRCYKCTVCGKDFLHQGDVNAHVRGVHHQVRRKTRGASKTASKSVKKIVEAD